MTTASKESLSSTMVVVEAYRLDRYDNPSCDPPDCQVQVVEAYRLDRYDNFN